MPKGLKRALKAAQQQHDDSHTAEDAEAEEDATMELEAARQIMAEQEAARHAAQSQETAAQQQHAYNKVTVGCWWQGHLFVIIVICKCTTSFALATIYHAHWLSVTPFASVTRFCKLCTVLWHQQLACVLL